MAAMSLVNSEEKASRIENAGRYAYINGGRFNEAHDEVHKRLDMLPGYADAFKALSDMLKRDSGSETLLTMSGSNGLAFICDMLHNSMYDAIIDLPHYVNMMRESISYDHDATANEALEAANG